MNIIQQEPAVSAGLAAAIASLAAGFGFHWSPGVVGAVLAALSLALSVIVRSKVTPAASLPSRTPAADEPPPPASSPPA